MFYKRLIYFGYYLKELDVAMFRKFLKHIENVKGKSKKSTILDIITCSLKYNISLLEYFQFHFYKIPPEKRQEFAGTGFMYEYQLKMNPRSSRQVLENKLNFLKLYNNYIHRDFASLKELEKDRAVTNRILENKSGKIVLKSSFGQCGIGIEVLNCKKFTPEGLINRLKETGNDLVEEFVSQHKEFMRLSPSGLNTIRIITQLDQNNKVDILAARLRITINSSVDNLAAGNIASPINIETGLVDGPAVYSDITREAEIFHPVTKVAIIDFKIPFWQQTIKMVKSAALLFQENRSIGWDVAITNEGPELIEGNHDWCKLLWQLPVGRGLKAELKKYLI